MQGGPGSFSFLTAGRILFGRGQATTAPDHIAQFGTRVLLVHGSMGGRSRVLSRGLQANGCVVQTIACAAEPSLPVLERAIPVARSFAPDVVVAIGGGSVIDLGKAIAALVPSDRAPVDHLEVVGAGLPLEQAPLPFVAMPTTAGTGAEVTKNSVIGVPDAKRKVSLRDDRMIADLAIVDPALTDNTPAHITLAVGLDALTQVIEPYLCNRATPMTDALSRPAISVGLAALRTLMEQDEDQAARDKMAWVSLCGGLALANSGLGAVHGLAGVIGGMCAAPHGAICGRLLPHVLAANAATVPPESVVAARLAEVLEEIARAFGADDADAGLVTMQSWCTRNGLPTLTGLGVSPQDYADIAENTLVSSSMQANPVALTSDQLVQVLRAAA